MDIKKSFLIKLLSGCLIGVYIPVVIVLCAEGPQYIDSHGLEMLRQDMERMELVPVHYYNFHPGSHTGLGAEKGIELIAKGLNDVLRPEINTTILLETMAGKGSEVGKSFEELQQIIDRVTYKNTLGV